MLQKCISSWLCIVSCDEKWLSYIMEFRCYILSWAECNLDFSRLPNKQHNRPIMYCVAPGNTWMVIIDVRTTCICCWVQSLGTSRHGECAGSPWLLLTINPKCPWAFSLQKSWTMLLLQWMCVACHIKRRTYRQAGTCLVILKLHCHKCRIWVRNLGYHVRCMHIWLIELISEILNEQSANIHNTGLPNLYAPWWQTGELKVSGKKVGKSLFSYKNDEWCMFFFCWKAPHTIVVL